MPLEQLTIARSAELERNHCRWLEQDRKLKLEEMTGSEEDDDEDDEILG